MALPRMRPKFSQRLDASPEAFYAALETALQTPGVPCVGARFGEGHEGGAILRRQEADQHVWSPALHLHIDGHGDGPHTLHGRFSPSSPVWTAFVAIYLSLTCIAICCACYGGAQMILDEDPWAFVGVPIALALAGFTYGAAFIGQGLGSDDMYELRHFVDAVVAASETQEEIEQLDAHRG